MTYSIAVSGASGYAGGEFLRLLLGHPAYLDGTLTLGAVTGASQAGARLGESQPHLLALADRIIEPTDAATLARHDVVILALPHGESARIAKQLPPEVLTVDLGADFRLESAADWEKWYGGTHAGTWTYGLPELPGQRDALRLARQIAVPGCFPTGASLALAPAVARGLTVPDFTVVSVTGTSGAGKAAKTPMLGSEVMGGLKAYGVGGTHRHTPEIIQNLQRLTEAKVTVSFTPILAPLPRGILTTASARLAEGIAEADVRSAYAEAYGQEPFVHVLPAGVQPLTKSVVGANAVHLSVEIDELAGRLVVTTAIDNLTKGTAGGALQSLNLALGLPETAGLPTTGLAP